MAAQSKVELQGANAVARASELHAALARTRLLVLDVDGVLTDGRIVYGAYGPADETPRFHVHDGLGLRWLIEAGVSVAWVTGRGCTATAHRARELGVDELHQRVKDKAACVRALQAKLAIARTETVAMGDDVPDFGLRAASAFFAAPANARDELRAVADLVTERSGGEGAVRELCEHILRARGRWEAILDAARR